MKFSHRLPVCGGLPYGGGHRRRRPGARACRLGRMVTTPAMDVVVIDLGDD